MHAGTLEKTILKTILKKMQKRSIYEKRDALLNLRPRQSQISIRLFLSAFLLGFVCTYLLLAHINSCRQPY